MSDMSKPVDTRQTTEIRQSPGRLLMLALIGLFLVGLSIMLVLGYAKETRMGALSVPVGWAGLVFFGAALAVTLKRLLQGSRVVISLSPSGLRDVRVAEKEIPWGAVMAVGTWEMSRQKVMVVQVPPEVEADLGLTFIARKTRAMNAKLGADGLAISAQGTKVDHETLLALTLAYLEQYRKPGSSEPPPS